MDNITIEVNNVIVTLKRIPGIKELPFGRQCVAFYIDKLSGITKEYNNLKKILNGVREYCRKEGIAVTYTTNKLRTADLKSKEIELISCEAGFYKKEGSYWYIP